MSLLGETAPDFTDPLGLLAACHQRMLNHCRLLERMPAWLDEHGIDDELQHSVSSVMRYFNTAAAHHHADEEQDLFPLLVADPDLAALIDRLQLEHQSLEAHWQELADSLHLIQKKQKPPAFETTIGTFADAYRLHIEVENRNIIPVAADLLDHEQLHRLGVAMAQRRGVTSME